MQADSELYQSRQAGKEKPEDRDLTRSSGILETVLI
jgi:hypothetical protein